MTQSDDSINRALQNIANYYQIQNKLDAAEIVGIHLEGPFISEHKVGRNILNMFKDRLLKRLRHFNRLPIN